MLLFIAYLFYQLSLLLSFTPECLINIYMEKYILHLKYNNKNNIISGYSVFIIKLIYINSMIHTSFD